MNWLEKTESAGEGKAHPVQHDQNWRSSAGRRAKAGPRKKWFQVTR